MEYWILVRYEAIRQSGKVNMMDIKGVLYMYNTYFPCGEPISLSSLEWVMDNYHLIKEKKEDKQFNKDVKEELLVILTGNIYYGDEDEEEDDYE